MELKEAIEHVRINTDKSHFDIQGPGEDEMMKYFNALSLVLSAAEKWAAFEWYMNTPNAGIIDRLTSTEGLQTLLEAYRKAKRATGRAQEQNTE